MIVKTEEQKDILREGGKRLGTLLRTLGKMVQPGVTTQELEDKAREIIASTGDTSATLGYSPAGARRPYPAALCVSINSQIVHGIPNEQPQIIKCGDIVSIDCLLKHKGLIVDSCITVGAGQMNDADKRLIAAAQEARTEAIKQAVTGNTVGDIAHSVQRVAEKYGYTSPRELGGHGVGRYVHEEPFIPNAGNKGSGEKLREGQVLAIEPIIMAGKPDIKLEADGYTYSSQDGSKSAQFEHTVIVGKRGAEILT